MDITVLQESFSAGLRLRRALRMLVATPAALLIVACAIPVAAHASEPYTAAAMWRLKRLADPAISPDGRLAVVPVTT